MQHFSYKTEKKRLKTRDGSTRRKKNTCRERFKGNVGHRHRQSDTNRSHKNTHATHTEIISCDNKILCKEEEHKYTNLVLQRGVCVCERCFAPKEKCGSGRPRGCALRTNLQNKTKRGIKKRKEWRKGERRRARRGRKGHFWKFLFVGRPFLFFILDSQLFS